ncbi:hypothetical protein [Mesorhizobium sp. M5C.F.Ca.IN.020.29.1.1]|uniref:hypothetical protein n=1 Tax=Mesorhizobium sp. M5C.F.Ca.IN.020.29.1.1 TaxID=2496770 RepID=UPI0013E0AA6A|nr:hypothetical protein [Mesorhizobium sp. M5C.F.Ca.IN.020.29.1.1]
MERQVAQVVAVEVQQIEGNKVEIVLAPRDGLAQAVKSDRPASLSTMLSPSMMALSTASDFDAAFFNDYLRPVAVEFDLMKPHATLGRLLNRGRQQWRDKLQTHALTRKNRDSFSMLLISSGEF